MDSRTMPNYPGCMFCERFAGLPKGVDRAEIQLNMKAP